MGLVRLRKSVRIVNHPPTQPETIAPVQQTRTRPRRHAERRQLFHLFIISTTVKPIFCCICNSHSSNCTAKVSRRLSCRLIDEVR